MESPKRQRHLPSNQQNLANWRQKLDNLDDNQSNDSANKEAQEKPSGDENNRFRVTLKRKKLVKKQVKGQGSSLLKNMRQARKSITIPQGKSIMPNSFKTELSKARKQMATSWRLSSHSNDSEELGNVKEEAEQPITSTKANLKDPDRKENTTACNENLDNMEENTKSDRLHDTSEDDDSDKAVKKKNKMMEKWRRIP